jgi:DNA ligase-1
MMLSDRHESGYALRFPRIVRLRPDKLAEDADTVERAREIFENQGKS